MKESIKEFFKKVGKNKELAEKFSAIKDPDEAYKLASSIQSGFSKQEFIDAMLKIQSAVDTFNELTDQDLAKVAGGWNLPGIPDSILVTDPQGPVTPPYIPSTSSIV